MEARFYRRAEIKEWESQLVNIPIEIQAQYDSISHHQNELKSLHQQLSEVERQIVPLDQKINGLSARIQIIKNNEARTVEQIKLPHHLSQLASFNTQLSIINPIVESKHIESERANRLFKIKKLEHTICGAKS